MEQLFAVETSGVLDKPAQQTTRPQTVSLPGRSTEWPTSYSYCCLALPGPHLMPYMCHVKQYKGGPNLSVGAFNSWVGR